MESLPQLDLGSLLASWLRELRGQRKSEHTWRSYQAAVQSFLTFCAEQDIAPELSKSNVIGWLGAQGGNQTSTVRLRLTAIKLFARWLADAEGFDADPVLAVKPPKSDQPSVPDLSENELRRMLKACDGAELRDKRDKAMLVLLAETGLRAAELLALDVTDVDLDGCVAHVRRGKGGKGRRVRFSVGAAATIDRYVRARHRAVSHPAQGPLWVSNRGARLTYTGLTSTLKGRAKDVGVVGFHVHRLRHTAAVRWLRSGGTETGLMAQAGWTSNTMVNRYVAAASEQLAGEEFDRLDLGIKSCEQGRASRDAVDGQTIALSAGTTDERAVTEALDLLVPDVVQLRVGPGAEARALTERLNAARAAMAGLCEGCGVADLAAARAAAAARTNAERDKREAADGIKRDLRDLTLDALTEKVERLETGIAEYTATRPSEPPLPDDLDAAQDRLSATNAALEECRAKLKDCEAAASDAASPLQDEKITDARLTAQLDQDRLALVQAERSLTEARSERSDDAIATELAAAEEKLKGAIEKLTAAEADLAAKDPDTLEMLLQNARAAKLRGASELRQNGDRRLKLRWILDREEGLAQQLDEAKTRLEHLAREHRSLEARAEAARLLYETFAARRAQAHQRYVAPFRERIEQLGRIVFGPSLEVELDDKLRVARRTLDGVTVDFDQLSTGAQEQLGIISRLACATIVTKDGGAPVIFDDALGWTDPRRLERMGAAIAVAGRDCQIIVLTRTPGRYASVGGATVAQLAG